MFSHAYELPVCTEKRDTSSKIVLGHSVDDRLVVGLRGNDPFVGAVDHVVDHFFGLLGQIDVFVEERVVRRFLRDTRERIFGVVIAIRAQLFLGVELLLGASRRRTRFQILDEDLLLLALARLVDVRVFQGRKELFVVIVQLRELLLTRAQRQVQLALHGVVQRRVSAGSAGKE